MSCDWEGNRRSGVALAMRHRLKWFIHLRAQGLSKGDKHPTNTLRGVWYSLPFISERELTFTLAICCRPSVCLSVVMSVVCL